MLYTHICRQNVLFRKLNLCLGFLIFPSQGAPVSLTMHVRIQISKTLHKM